jgi:hypothetical protein
MQQISITASPCCCIITPDYQLVILIGACPVHGKDLRWLVEEMIIGHGGP